MKTSLQKFHDSYIVNHKTECWEWARGRSKKENGYGIFSMRGLAHRWSYSEFIGPIPDGMYVLHRCDNPCCVNPEHLWTGTQRENLKDMKDKGRSNPYKGPRPWLRKQRELNGEKVSTAKLTAHQVLEIRGICERKEFNQKTLATRFSVSEPTINAVVLRKTWKHI